MCRRCSSGPCSAPGCSSLSRGGISNDPRLLLALLLSPAAVLCIISGQSSLVTAAILVGIFSCLDRKPVVAGVLIALLTLKPQLGLLFPFMLLASGRWRVFIVAAVTTLAIAAVTVALFGPQVWADFILKGLPVNNIVLSDPDGIATPFYPTVFINLRGVGASYALAMAVQLCFAAVAVATVVWAFRYRRNADPRILMALFFACSISFVPYLLAYDTLALTLRGADAARRRQARCGGPAVRPSWCSGCRSCRWCSAPGTFPGRR